ncbi:MAG: ATP-binding cassette domain-containing protein [Candidatus Aminicenantes bacterium]|nr:ATP-binding cassette domain-containing protein [Candidatus Aminicenantes bacterium]
MSLIEVVNVVKSYNNGKEAVWAVNDVSLTIELGEFVAVMGPSGSGKSTLLSMLGGLTHPTQGVIQIDELDVYSLATEQRADFRKEYIGFVFQAFFLIPYLTAIENVMIPLTVTSYSHAEKRELAMDMLEKVGLQHKSKRLPNELSGGELERVAIARALVNRPPIILADEPTGNLDSKTSQEIMERFQRLNQDQQTIIMVTHNPQNLSFAQRCITLCDGKIVQDEIAA